jgi:sec-independent protein translocase protein TatC
MAASPSADDPTQEQPFVSHLLELRDRLLRMVAAVFVVFLALFPFSNDLYLYVATPLMSHMPAGTSMIATGVATPFLTPFKLSLVAAVFLSMPIILYQFWAFVAPGLYLHEKRLVIPLLISSTVLFYLGMLFAYYVVFPLVFAFFIGTTPEGVAVMTDISQYLDFVLTLFFAFGVAFEVPIATVLLVWMGMTTPEAMGRKRPYVIVGAFVLGMVLTPPDVISQTLLALPMWVLFEVGVQASKFFVRDPDATDDREPDDRAAPAQGGRPVTDPSDRGGGSMLVGAEISGGDPHDPDRFVPLTEEEMEAELDAIETEDSRHPAAAPDPEGTDSDPIDAKLRRVQTMREAQDEAQARRLLYEVLAEGNEGQRRVARNILAQLDTP